MNALSVFILFLKLKVNKTLQMMLSLEIDRNRLLTRSDHKLNILREKKNITILMSQPSAILAFYTSKERVSCVSLLPCVAQIIEIFLSAELI